MLYRANGHVGEFVHEVLVHHANGVGALHSVHAHQAGQVAADVAAVLPGVGLSTPAVVGAGYDDAAEVGVGGNEGFEGHGGVQRDTIL